LSRTAPILTLLATLLLAGCAGRIAEPLPEGLTDQPPENFAQLQQQRAGFTHWTLQGKLAVRQPSDSGSAVINQWTQQGAHYQLALSSSFLVIGRTRMSGVPGYIELAVGGETYRSSDPDSLLEDATGWRLPIDSLVWWVRGLPDPGEDYRLLFNEDEELAAIRQSDWEIRYERWNGFVEDMPPLPARITAVKGDKQIRVVVTRWSPSEDDA